MTTIIFECKPGSFSYDQVHSLLKIYGHEDIKTDWKPQSGGVGKNQLLLTELPMVSMSYIPLDGIQKVHFDDAMQRLIEFEAKHAAPINAQECLKLAAMLINDDLQSDDTPEHQKGDLRCMRAIIDTLNKHTPFTPDNNVEDNAALQYRCTSSMREIVRSMMTVYQDAMSGHYHQPRNTEPEQLEETA